MKRPDWNTYYMTLAFLISQRSIDTSTKCGCIAVAADNTPLSMGYNSPPRGCDDANIPMTRPEKYEYMVHSEEAMIANAARNGISLRGSTLYVTGIPCNRCLRMIINAGITKVIYGNNTAKMSTPEVAKVIDVFMKDRKDLELIHLEIDNEILGLLDQTKNLCAERFAEIAKKA